MFDPRAVKCPSDLPNTLPVIIETQGTLNLRARQALSYSFHWLRQIALGAVAGDLGFKINAGGEVTTGIVVKAAQRQEISVDQQGRLRLRVFKSRNSNLDCAAQIYTSELVATPLPRRQDELVAAILGVHESQWLPASARSVGSAGQGLLSTLLKLRDSIYQQAVGVVEKEHEARVSWRYASAAAETALVDCSFAFTDDGLAAYRLALSGDYSWILDADPAHVDVREGALTSGLRSVATVELHLPFLGRKEWISRLETFARMEVSSDAGGRLLVYHVEAAQRIASRSSYQAVLALAGGLSVGRVHTKASFTLSYSDQRTLPCTRAARSLAPVLEGYGFAPGAAQWLETLATRAGEVDASLSLTIPGSLAEAWLDAPSERDPRFFAYYSRMSVAVQRAFRLWLPYIYFADAARYDTLESAFPLVVYQVSRPFACKSRCELTYDVLSEQSMRGFFHMAGQQLPAELARVEELLVREGRKRTAAFYRPRQADRLLASVRRSPRLLNSLLAADAFLVDSLVNLGCRANQLRLDSAKAQGLTAAKNLGGLPRFPTVERAARPAVPAVSPAETVGMTVDLASKTARSTGLVAARLPCEGVKGLSSFAGEFVKAVHGRLRRLYAGHEFLALGGLLLVEATNALSAASGRPSSIQACMRVSQGPAGSPEAIRQTLVNASYLPAGDAHMGRMDGRRSHSVRVSRS